MRSRLYATASSLYAESSMVRVRFRVQAAVQGAMFRREDAICPPFLGVVGRGDRQRINPTGNEVIRRSQRCHLEGGNAHAPRTDRPAYGHA